MVHVENSVVDVRFHAVSVRRSALQRRRPRAYAYAMAKDTIVLKVGEYFMAVEGLAMMRHIITDPERGRARGEDIRRIVENFGEFPQNLDLPVTEHDVESGYTKWAPKYDGPGNMAIEYEEPVVHGLLEKLPVGDALDAACGTGRHAAMLTQLGHSVVGVDATEAMLAVARAKVAGADFRQGTLESMPIDSASVDLLTCALALTHVADLTPVISEFARVLRSDGKAIISDIHPFAAMTGLVAAFPTDDGGLGVPFVESRAHEHSEYVTAFHDAGLRVKAVHRARW